VATGGGAREAARAGGRVLRAFVRQAPVARESPCAVDEDAHADPFALGIRHPVDPSVLGRDELLALEHDARVGVLGTGRGRGGDGGCTEIAHGVGL
jgi:hypothetical protein